MSRPEHQAPPEMFYDQSEARKYGSSSRMIEIQSSMTERAMELLALPDDGKSRLLLDIGCGSGLSGNVISEEGHVWIGVDISSAMLDVAMQRETEGDLVLLDMGQGVPFRLGVFDGAVSVSALQWLCHENTRKQNSWQRLKLFFETLYKSLAKGSRAVFQFYPENEHQMEQITAAAMKTGFSGGVVIDFPNSTKAKKYFLCLFSGAPSEAPTLPAGLGEDTQMGEASSGQQVSVLGRDSKKKRHHRGSREPRVSVKSKTWIMHKKEVARRRGKEVKSDSKYSGRKRGPYF